MCCFIAKYLLFAFNFVFWLAGVALLGVGIWINVDNQVQNTVEILGTSIVITSAIVLIVAGSIMLLFGFVGCCGAIKESTCLLGTYTFLLVLVLGLEIGIGIWALAGTSVDQLVKDNLPTTQLTSDNQNDSIVATEQNLHCCGYSNGCADWNGTAYGCQCDPNTDKHCLNATDSDCIVTGGTGYYNQTCETAMITFLEDNMTLLGWIAIGIGLIEIVGIIISVGLCCHFKNNKSGPE